jgi:hypothetical protein
MSASAGTETASGPSNNHRKMPLMEVGEVRVGAPVVYLGYRQARARASQSQVSAGWLCGCEGD